MNIELSDLSVFKISTSNFISDVIQSIIIEIYSSVHFRLYRSRSNTYSDRYVLEFTDEKLILQLYECVYIDRTHKHLIDNELPYLMELLVLNNYNEIKEIYKFNDLL